MSTVTWQKGCGGRGEEFFSVGFEVKLTLMSPFIITLSFFSFCFFARPLVAPVRKRGGGEMDSGEMESMWSTMILVRVCDVPRGLVSVGVWSVVESGWELWVCMTCASM